MTINMKKHSAFDNIPTLPRTFSGQWMTFSHMANHYRKLLNVKPRVDTGIPHPLAPDERKAQPKKIKGKHFKFERPVTTTECKPKSKWTRPRLASKMVDYEYHALSHGLIHSPNGSFNAGSSSDGYQVVFGPSSLKSSVDAMISDQEHEGSIVLEPKVSSISIGEKIRKFLDNIHAQESQLRLAAGNRPLQNSRERKVPISKPKESSDTRMNRHSNCFAPFEVSSPGTKKRSAKPSSSSAAAHNPSLIHRCPTTADSKRSAKTNETMKASANQRLTAVNTKKAGKKITTVGAFQDMYPAFNRTTNPSTRLSRKGSKKHMTSPNMSPRSVSVGTIHGSEELVEEFMVPSPSLPRNLSTFQIDTSDIPADWLKERVERGVVRINNAYFSLAPGTSASSLGIHQSSSQHHPNKDSSRDSAYGFSSGESRITTRESTPEKKSSKATKKGCGSFEPNDNNASRSNGQYKSSLSTVASSINQDNNNSRSQSHVNSSGRSSCSEKSMIVPPPPSNRYDTKNKEFSKREGDKYDWMSERRYIRFLTKVTDDIVTKGIYTNKGIKNIFKTHIMRNNELEMDKMLYLLERLRMDMGVPKDDSLNHLDFGYGSVDYSTEPYFYRKPETHEEEEEGEEQPESEQDNKSAVQSVEESISDDDNGNSIAD